MLNKKKLNTTLINSSYSLFKYWKYVFNEFIWNMALSNKLLIHCFWKCLIALLFYIYCAVECVIKFGRLFSGTKKHYIFVLFIVTRCLYIFPYLHFMTNNFNKDITLC